MNYKELIKNFTKDDFFSSRVNLHIHTKYSDGSGDFVSLVNDARDKGYKWISITDHNTMQGYLENGIPENVIPGVEFDCWHGAVFMHLLGYGVDFNSEELKRYCAQSKQETEWDIVRIFTPHRAKQLIEAIHNAGGIAVLAHPACCWCLSLDKFVYDLKNNGLDGIEVYYPYERHRGIIKFHTETSVEKVASKYNLIKTGGTDVHTKTLVEKVL